MEGQEPDNPIDPNPPEATEARSGGVEAIGGVGGEDRNSGAPRSPLMRWWPWVVAVVVVAVLAYPLLHRSTSSDSAAVANRPQGASADALVSPSLPAAGWLSLSLRSYQQQRYVEAIGCAETALRIQPNYPEAYNNISASYTSLRLYDLAIAAAQDALRLKPDFALARNNLQWAMHEKAAHH